MQAKKSVAQMEWIKDIDCDIENIYDDECLNESVDNDMISAAEEGFMIGYMEA